MALTKISRGLLNTGVSDSSDATAITIDSSENVGIGVTTPFSQTQITETGWSSGAPYGTVLTVTGNNTNDANWGHLLITDSSTGTGNGGMLRFAVGSTSSDISPHSGIDGFTEGSNYGGLKFLTRPNGGTSTERMRITANGSIGIGTTAPEDTMHILGSTGSTIDIGADNSAEPVVQFIPDSTNSRNGRFRMAGTNTPENNSVAIISDASTNVGMCFVTTGSGTKEERMTIDSLGNLLVGTLAISQGASTSSSVPTRMSVNSASGNEVISFNSSTNTHYGSCYADSGGSGLFGKGTRTAAIVGTGMYNYTSQTPDIIYFYVDGTLRYTISSSGGANASDEKFKENIEDITYGLDTIKSLQPRKFKWKDKGEVTGEDSIGFIAQEVEPLISEIVSSPTDGAEGGEVGKVLNYSALTAVLTKAVQELSAKVEELESKINE